MTEGATPTWSADADAHAQKCLRRVRGICLPFPGAAEKVSHGSPTFYTRKVFAVFGGSLKGDHDAPVARNALLFLPDESEREALVQDDCFFVPAYLGPAGWLGLSFHRVGDVDRVDWDEVAELVEMSYRLTAPVTLIRELDGQAGSTRGR
ncbi:MmcQ/YjbR family DNA-binding protein [Ornithinimicrobium pratense]|uniref:MmcQ/YjbR family DNA-binding protein n=1 Tax=Ornithinimicrobium pratense TaxID=2593973 RepID=A0A5J6V801_9MICO|nr:MmcQ/YjbR family DNA-binding protein [Ornithinimicrobium pratense]QFG69979.1 MmcQ/YjbR family DNA-binding protein [Ornithinimicrobium pratense]